MEVELISIGSELTSGKVINTNASFMTRILEIHGIKTLRITTIGDEKDSIIRALKNCLPEVKAVIVTGGLGPTPDDITRTAVSQSFGRKLVENLEATNAMNKLYRKWGLKPEEIDVVLNYFPQGATLIPNPIGVFGFYLEYQGKLYFFIPGVPEEMKLMILSLIHI